jgi:hypothetical protein
LHRCPFLELRSQKLEEKREYRILLLACDSCAIGKAKTVFLGVGVGIGIGVALLKTDPDSDPDPES